MAAAEPTQAKAQHGKVGACYNVFDGEELLEASIKSLHPVVTYVVVVYQETSHFGAKNPALLGTLTALQEAGLIHDLIPYTPKHYSPSEAAKWFSPLACPCDTGGAGPASIGQQFIGETVKREMGRAACLAAGCAWFMSMDADECYLWKELAAVVGCMEEGGYQAALTNMAYYWHSPTVQLGPLDPSNFVPAVYACTPHTAFRLCAPYPVLVDPTRRLHGITRVLVVPPSVCCMHHFSFVRRNIASKLHSVSNKGNYTGVAGDGKAWCAAFDQWRPGHHVPHPHPHFAAHFTTVTIVPNTLGITTGLLQGLDEGASFPIPPL